MNTDTIEAARAALVDAVQILNRYAEVLTVGELIATLEDAIYYSGEDAAERSDIGWTVMTTGQRIAAAFAERMTSAEAVQR